MELYEDGTFQVRSSAAEMGQGLVTVMRTIVAEEMSVSPDRVKVLVMDTDLTPNGGPTTASRQTFVTGNASRYAAKTLRDQITAVMAEKYDIRPEQIRYADGIVHVNGHSLTYADVYKEMNALGRQPRVRYEYEAPKTQPLGTGGDMHFAFSFGVQAAEVEVNKLTGEVRVLRVISANDVGMAVNPLGLQGQVQSAMVYGLTAALYGRITLADGRVEQGNFGDYPLLRIDEMLEMAVHIVPSTAAPTGVGEPGTPPIAPAVANAVAAATGKRLRNLPFDLAA